MVLIIGLPDYALYSRDVCMVSSLRKDKYVRTVADGTRSCRRQRRLTGHEDNRRTTIGHIRLMHETHVD